VEFHRSAASTPPRLARGSAIDTVSFVTAIPDR
jgi:hypothetical protein